MSNGCLYEPEKAESTIDMFDNTAVMCNYTLSLSIVLQSWRIENYLIFLGYIDDNECSNKYLAVIR